MADQSNEKYSELSVKELQEIITKLQEGKKVNIEQEYNQSSNTVQKIRSFLRNNDFIPCGDQCPLPRAYLSPQSLEEKLRAAVFNLGFTVKE